ncbi:hypothetical protein GCM10022271_17480 [Corallibacter vietnamensis]|uniref:GNAT family N-acetyltransferase n=1 Tax=Corallibacter vietnamensis TaxID=904130 RepID=A0ABP7H5J9_9FLAO
MNDYNVVAYTSKYYDQWNSFVAQAKNATFLFHRDFIEYHQDRFEDASKMIFKGDKLVALFPANKNGDTIYSHQGLTYGGLLLKDQAVFTDVLNVFKELLAFFNKLGVNDLVLKMLPRIYNKLPSDTLDYFMFILNAQLVRSDITMVIENSHRLELTSSNRKRGLKKAKKQNLVVKEEEDLSAFWNQILVPNLRDRFNVKPVHTLQEITYLKSKFPKNIRQFNVYKNDEIVAGTTIFESEMVAHAQYISANNQKQELGSLDMIFHHLIEDVFASKKYFDFGICNENEGKQINQGLLSWKESFGARSISQNFYKIETSNYKNLNTILK